MNYFDILFLIGASIFGGLIPYWLQIISPKERPQIPYWLVSASSLSTCLIAAFIFSVVRGFS